MNRINTNKRAGKLAIFLFFTFLSLTTIAQNKDKKITIQNKNISLKEAFAQIETQTGYSIAYEQSNLNIEKKHSLSFKNVTIDKAMAQLLKETGYVYKIKGYHIIISSQDNKQKPANNDTQKLTQTIRGIVVDSKTNTPIEYASVCIAEDPSRGGSTDGRGNFRINNVPVGRYNIQASFMGYRPSIISEVSVTSSKEVFVEIPMDENVQDLAEVLIKPEIKKDRTVNPMAITGGRMISIEEASRFANGFDDPARLSSAFAGVAGDVGTNAVAIRGNAPQFTQWRLEGIEIPNPTHFADLSGLGGGFLSALSTQVIGNSDFYNGAFPAEYSNALSGVFDMHLRNGNNQKYEHAFQVGLMGIDLASEGPINKKRGSSYLVITVTKSQFYGLNRCKSTTCKFLSRDPKSARDKNGTKPRKNKVKNTLPEISLVEYLCFVCKGTNLSLEKRGEIPISLIHNSFSYHCTQNVVIASGFDLKRHGLRKSGVKYCFALCWAFSKTRTGNRTKDLPPLLSNPWLWECLSYRHLKMQNFKRVSDQSTTIRHGKIEPKN